MTVSVTESRALDALAFLKTIKTKNGETLADMNSVLLTLDSIADLMTWYYESRTETGYQAKPRTFDVIGRKFRGN